MIKDLIEDVRMIREKIYLQEKVGYNQAVDKVMQLAQSYKVYDELVEKVSSWWDEIYPEDIFTGVSSDDGAIKVAEIRKLLDRIKALSERGKICANCDRDIYWSHGILNWCHFDKTISCGERNGYKLFAELKIEEDRKDVCKHCGREIFHNGKVWIHLKHATISCVVIDEVAEPKDDLIILDEVQAIPTDCIECNEIRYGGSGKYADFAVCHIIDMGDYGYRDPSFVLFRFKKNKPKNHIPPTWCPLKAKEPEKTYPNLKANQI